MTDYSIPPTDTEIIEAFTEFVAERESAGVLLAKAVADVTFADGQVRVTLDPARSGAEYWALIETSSFDNLAELFGVPIKFSDDRGVWLRGRVTCVNVVDVDGRPLGAKTSEELDDSRRN